MSKSLKLKVGRFNDTPDKSEWNDVCRKGNHKYCKNKKLNKRGEKCKCPCHITVQQESDA